jgi:tRNA-splicing endonuclease subunit Sen2
VEICDIIVEGKANSQYAEENISDNREGSIDDIIEISSNPIKSGSKQIEAATKEIDEVVLDSAEEDDVCVIVNKDSDKDNNITDSPKTRDDQNSLEKQKDKEELSELDYYDFKNDSVNEEDDLNGKLLVLPDSDSDTENYLKNIEPQIKNEGFPIQEALHLSFEETFFLLFGLGCLQIIHFDGSLLDINSAWLYFCKERSDFLQKYVVYHYYRSKGWVVKPGLKYGGDFR